MRLPSYQPMAVVVWPLVGRFGKTLQKVIALTVGMGLVRDGGGGEEGEGGVVAV